MTVVQSVAWGALGFFLVEAAELSTSIRRSGKFPWRQPGGATLLPFVIAEILRLMVSSGLVAALAATGQVSSAIAAAAIGATAPRLIEIMASFSIPLATKDSHETPASRVMQPYDNESSSPFPVIDELERERRRHGRIQDSPGVFLEGKSGPGGFIDDTSEVERQARP